jgi:hypothetical protein
MVSCLTDTFTLKMEAVFASETSVNIYQTTRRHIPEDSTLHSHCCENNQHSSNKNVPGIIPKNNRIVAQMV